MPRASAHTSHCDQTPKLTSRERDVLKLLGAGLRNREIAEELCVETSTVEFHVSNILAKLGARSRVEAAVKARDLGLSV